MPYEPELGHQNIGVCEGYLLGCLRYREKHAKYILISCGCLLLLQIRNSVVNMVVMGLVFGESLIVISIQKYFPSIMGRHCFCLHINCLQTCECMSAHWAIKVYVSVKFHKRNIN